MPYQEDCEAAVNGLREARQLLLTPSPEVLEQCAQTLGQVLEHLQSLAGRRQDLPAGMRAVLLRLQAEAGGLERQIEHGANMISGWMQLRMGEGYTRSGRPEFADPEAGSLLEA